MVRLSKLSTPTERLWYAQQAIRGLVPHPLEANIRDQLQQRIGAASTDFQLRLPAPNSEVARQTLKDPSLFEFRGLGNEANERAIETGLIAHITQHFYEPHCGFHRLVTYSRVTACAEIRAPAALTAVVLGPAPAVAPATA